MHKKNDLEQKYTKIQHI